MKHRVFSWAIGISVVLVLAGAAAFVAVADLPTPTHFSGVINDYTAVAGGTGPWEVRGPWTLNLHEESGKADFSAAVTMELSDFSLSGANISASARMQHTHNLTVDGGMVTPITGGFEVTGPVTITKDGGPAPAALQGSIVVIDVTGGTLVRYSDITLTFENGAATHFGSNPLHGVVRKADRPRDER
ncbi:MAG TPA: hypothetical protein VMD77_08885 [Candidatus Baltobacteraceae bacterium]|jgi:hypothetical protein|nr:hypothetical protein [Candidatus Baltobacteraceae bacterium]